MDRPETEASHTSSDSLTPTTNSGPQHFSSYFMPWTVSLSVVWTTDRDSVCGILNNWARIRQSFHYSYLLLICIYMECLCFKLEFGHFLPEMKRRDRSQRRRRGGRRQRQKQRERRRHREGEQTGEEGRGGGRKRDKNVEILMLAGGRLISPTISHFWEFYKISTCRKNKNRFIFDICCKK